MSYEKNVFFIYFPVAFLVAAAALLTIGYIKTTKIGAVVLMTVSVAFSGLITAGPPINQIDIAPQFGGVLMGISNMAGTLPGILGPLAAKTIAHTVTKQETFYQL